MITLPILALVASSIVATARTNISVWPLPSHYTSGSLVLWIAEDVEFSYRAASNVVLSPLRGARKSFRC